MQDPTRIRSGRTNAVNFKRIGVNTFLGLWRWPTDADGYPGWSRDRMAELQRVGLHAIAGEDTKWIDGHPQFARTLRGYQIGDEPDMKKVNGDPVDQPRVWAARGKALGARAGDRERHANFGKGFCLDPWPGYRGNESVDFPQYVSAATIVSCDYYAVTDPYEARADHGIWGYGRGVDNMEKWAGGRDVWGFVEASAPFPDGKKANNLAGRMPPSLLSRAVWMLVIHGADGVEYFCHDFSAGIVEDGCLADRGMPRAMKRVNASLQRYAGVLAAPDVAGTTARTTGGVAVTTLTKRVAGATYVFAIGDGNRRHPDGLTVRAEISVRGRTGGVVHVLGENRVLPIRNGRFVDRFRPYEHHVYQIRGG